VRPGVPLQVAAVDAAGGLVGERIVPPLERGEQRVVELLVERDLRALAGRVVTIADAPVAGASVAPKAAGAGAATIGPELHGETVRTDADGRFRLDDLAVDEVELVAAAPGFAVRRVRRRVTDAPLEIVLEPGREVRVVVTDAAGAPVRDARVQPDKEGDTWWNGRAEEREPGEYVAAGAPSGTVAFEVVAAGRRIPGAIEPGEDVAHVRLDPAQPCTFELGGTVELLEGLSRAYVQIASRDGVDVGWFTVTVEEDEREARLPRLFPGRYEATVRGNGFRGTQDLSDPVPFEIAGTAPARVRIELRAE
jgi:hypothetical protein